MDLRRKRGHATSLIIVTLLALSSGACLPHVGHGPRVEPGTSLFLGGSVTHSPDLQDEQISFMPTINFGMSHGWVSDGGAAASVGVQFPVLSLPIILLGDFEFEAWSSLLLADVYVQPRRANGGIDWGAGAMFSRHIIAPYVQAGSVQDGGVYTTQMVARTHTGLNDVTYWIPTFAHRTVVPGSGRAVDFYVSGAIGWMDDDGRRPRSDLREWFISTGVVLELRPGQ